MAKNKKVHIIVSPLFFDNIFEPERKKLQKIKKTSFSQRSFTEYLAKVGAKIKLPKFDERFIEPRFRKNNLKKNKNGGFMLF